MKLSKKVKDSVYVVIAAYNEESSIRDVVKDLQKNGFRNVIVVDDGSRDDTIRVAEKAGATVLVHVVNRGQGAALKTGIDYSVEKGAGFVVTFDADGQHQTKDLPKMIKPVADGEVDVTLGSRFLEGSGSIPFGRKFLLKGSVIVQRIFYGLRLSDAHNGFRVLSRKAAEEIEVTSDRMEHASQIAEEIVKKGLSFREVPVDILYTDYSLEKGHGSFLGGLKVLWQFFIRKLFK